MGAWTCNNDGCCCARWLLKRSPENWGANCCSSNGASFRLTPALLVSESFCPRNLLSANWFVSEKPTKPQLTHIAPVHASYRGVPLRGSEESHHGEVGFSYPFAFASDVKTSRWVVPAPSDLGTEKVTGLDGRVGEDKCPQINVHSSFRLRYVAVSPSWSIVYTLHA